MDKKMLENRREKLLEKLKDNEAVILFGADEATLYLPFLQDNNFLYFTGLNIPEAIFFFCKRNGKADAKLFIQRSIPERIVWDGEKMLKEEAIEISGIERVFYLDDFENIIFYDLFSLEKLYIKYDIKSLNSPLGKSLIFVNKIKDKFPQLGFDNIHSKIAPLRSIKEKWETEQLQKAIEATGTGLMSVFKNARAGMMEYELEAMIYFEFRSKGLKHWGFSPIVAAGKNAATLHYGNNDTKIKKGQLVLLDVGAACNNYSADITRTFPIDRKFTKRQKEVYGAVLRVQKEIISMIRPGIGLSDLNKKTVELITAEIKSLKLIEKDEDYKKYYMHSVSHHLGMDTHDPGSRESVLEAGNVITVEPGIYIPEENLGVRIEDDILVTPSGNINLSFSIPKEIEELEEIRSNVLS